MIICIKTDTGIFSRIKSKNYFIIFNVYSGLDSRYYKVSAVWIIFASLAEAKSKQNTWIFLVNDL